MDHDKYKFAVGMKYDLKTKNLTFKKIKYIQDETFADFKWEKRKSLNFQLALVYVFFLWFLRMFGHYIGQYFIMLLMGVKVTKFEAHWYKIDVEFAGFLFKHQAAAVSCGILFNTMAFVSMCLIAVLMRMFCRCFPRIWYKIVCWFGVYTVLDPIFVLIIDLICLVSDFHH